jgi:hypothetical protein
LSTWIRVRDAGGNRRVARGFEREVKPEDAARGDIDRELDPGASDALAAVIINDMDVDQRVIDLNDGQRGRLA